MSAPRGWPADGRLTVQHVDRGSCWPAVADVPHMGGGAYLVGCMDDDGALHHGTGGRLRSAWSNQHDGMADRWHNEATAGLLWLWQHATPADSREEWRQRVQDHLGVVLP